MPENTEKKLSWDEIRDLCPQVEVIEMDFSDLPVGEYIFEVYKEPVLNKKYAMISIPLKVLDGPEGTAGRCASHPVNMGTAKQLGFMKGTLAKFLGGKENVPEDLDEIIEAWADIKGLGCTAKVTKYTSKTGKEGINIRINEVLDSDEVEEYAL